MDQWAEAVEDSPAGLCNLQREIPFSYLHIIPTEVRANSSPDTPLKPPTMVVMAMKVMGTKEEEV